MKENANSAFLPFGSIPLGLLSACIWLSKECCRGEPATGTGRVRSSLWWTFVRFAPEGVADDALCGCGVDSETRQPRVSRLSLQFCEARHCRPHARHLFRLLCPRSRIDAGAECEAYSDQWIEKGMRQRLHLRHLLRTISHYLLKYYFIRLEIPQACLVFSLDYSTVTITYPVKLIVNRILYSGRKTFEGVLIKVKLI